VVVENLKGIVCTVLHFHAAANITTGFVITSAETNVGETLEEISSAFFACCHPLVVPVTFCEASILAVRTHLDKVHTELSTIEDRQNKEDDTRRAWRYSETQLGTRDLKVIVGQGKELASAKDNLRSVKLATNFVLEQLKPLQVKSGGNQHDEGRQNGGIARKCLENRLAVLSSTLVHLDSFKSLEHRLQSQLQLVSFNLLPLHVSRLAERRKNGY
jgi:hypothetical protein